MTFLQEAIWCTTRSRALDDLLARSDLVHDSLSRTAVDFDATNAFKQRLVEKVWENFKAGARADLRPAYEQFCGDQNYWLDDYALFRALKAKFRDTHYLEWPSELVRRKPAALGRARRELANEIGELCFAQFLVFRQADRLKNNAHRKGLSLIGDLPFFVSGDSSDVWAHPELFLLDEKLHPSFVAGVPPDYFSAHGQLWGNPLYNWESLRQSGCRWWIARLSSLLSHVDVIRLDHFRAFAAAWHVPARAPTAESGSWLPGPGAEFFQAVQRGLGGLPFIAEDLGMITPDVYALRDQFHLPGMRILQFAFDGHSDNPYLPENFGTNTVVYTGTHDNPTTRGWFEDLQQQQRDVVCQDLKQRGTRSSETSHAMMELGWSSVADLSMAPLQDLLNLAGEDRMNVPGRPEANWRWRCTEEMMSDQSFEWLGALTNKANRWKSVTSASAPMVETASRNWKAIK